MPVAVALAIQPAKPQKPRSQLPLINIRELRPFQEDALQAIRETVVRRLAPFFSIEPREEPRTRRGHLVRGSFSFDGLDLTGPACLNFHLGTANWNTTSAPFSEWYRGRQRRGQW
jgi:hypothetical protein